MNCLCWFRAFFFFFNLNKNNLDCFRTNLIVERERFVIRTAHYGYGTRRLNDNLGTKRGIHFFFVFFTVAPVTPSSQTVAVFTRRYVHRRPYECNPLKSKRSVRVTLDGVLGVRAEKPICTDAVDITVFVVRFTEKTWTDVFAEDSDEHTLMG